MWCPQHNSHGVSLKTENRFYRERVGCNWPGKPLKYIRRPEVSVWKTGNLLRTEITMIRILFCVFISLVCDQEAESLIICRQRKFDPRLIKAYSHSDLPRLSPQEQDMYQVSSCRSKQNEMAINSQRLKTKRKRKGKAITVMDFYRCPRGSRYSALREKCVPRFFGKWLNVLHCCDLEAWLRWPSPSQSSPPLKGFLCVLIYLTFIVVLFLDIISVKYMTW